MKKGKLLVFFVMLVFLTVSYVSADTLKLGSSGQAVADLQEQLKKLGYFVGGITGYFGSDTQIAVKEFQVSKGFIATGTVDSGLNDLLYGIKRTAHKTNITSASQPGQSGSGQTVEGVSGQGGSKVQAVKANTAAAKNSKIEVLDWWKDARYVFKIGTVATVIDVRTGKSFKIKRTYGSNHADCETLTQADTNTMKEIWGGEWNWSRRPVILEIGGRKLAASMAGMPHAGLDEQPANALVSSRSGDYGRGYNLDTVKDNGMNGHFDVHFLNSRTHGTNRVDPQHQAAIKEAAKAVLKE